MAKSHGKNGVIYLGANTAAPVAETKSEDLSLGTDFADSTPQGSTFKQYMPGLKDFKIKLDKFYDDAYFTMIDAALNDTVLKFYFYADRNTTGNYFYGQVYLSMDSLKSDIGDVNMESWSVVPAGAITLRHN